MKQPLLILTGPTAVGKSALSISLAKALHGEILSADSMQVYRHMDIGSAKLTTEEMKGVRHHLIDVIEPTGEFHVKKFQSLAYQAMEGIYQRGNLPIMVGGTGFYIQAVLYDVDFTAEDGDAAYRKLLEERYDNEGADELFAELLACDPASAEGIHKNNKKRIIRALEYYRLTGERISEHNKRERGKASAYRFLYVVLNDDRQKIYAAIDARVDAMMEAGLVEEVQGLLAMGVTRQMTAMQGLGYKEIAAYLCGEISLEEAVCRIKRDTRHFAKRQITWFKRERNVTWVDRREFPSDKAIGEYIIKKWEQMEHE